MQIVSAKPRSSVRTNSSHNPFSRRPILESTTINPESTFSKSKKYAAVSLYSGGLDSTLASLLAMEKLRGEMLLLMVNVSPFQKELTLAVARAAKLGADLLVMDSHERFSAEYLSEALIMNSNYQGYPLGTPMARAFAVSAAAEILKRCGQKGGVIVHGCMPEQNTRFRMESLASQLGLASYGPFIENPSYERKQKVALLSSRGIEVLGRDGFATDESMWCRAVEGQSLNDLSRVPRDSPIFEWTTSPQSAPNMPVRLALSFSQGKFVALNGSELSLHNALLKLVELGGKHAIGRIMVIEDTMSIMSKKIRDFYEAPGAAILLFAHGLVESCVLSKAQREIKSQLDKRWGEAVYEGYWFHRSVRDMAEIGWEMQKNVSGEVLMELYKGNMCLVEANIPSSILLTAGKDKDTY